MRPRIPQSFRINSISDVWVALFLLGFSISVIRQANYLQFDFIAPVDTLLIFIQGFSLFLSTMALIFSNWNLNLSLIKKILTNRTTLFLLIYLFIQTCRAPGNTLYSLASNFYLLSISFGFYVLSESRWRNHAKRNRDIKVLLFAFSLVLLFGLLIGFLEENYPARVRGLIEGPNFLGLFSSIFLALLAFFKISKVTFNRAYYIILVFVGGISLEASGTRASAITLFLFLLILMILSENSRKQICSFGALVMVAGILFTLANNFYPNYEKILESGAIISVTNSGYTSSGRILRINPGEGEGGVFSGRIGIWKLYGEKVIEKPILGHGFNPVSSLENIYPHNILILLAYYFGIPFTLIVCYKFSRLCRRLIIARKYKLLNVLVFLTLNSLFADFIFGAGGPIWLSMGLLIVLSVHSSDHAP